MQLKWFTRILFSLAWLAGAVALLPAQDWPMWRHDPGRTAVTPAALAETLYLQWIRELGAPAPAWPPTQQKLQFDAVYEPVALGKTLFVPSMAADRLTAYDTQTGQERWRFYTEGPVRFAPVAYGDKVALISDDGHLYCLRASDGTLQWKLRGGPADRWVLGNERLISTWPARGGPVLRDGILYFSASIWPFMGTFLYAVNAESGEVLWSNSGSGADYLTQQHSSPAFAGVAPQGYFTASQDILLVSGGRSVPAAYDRHTGQFLYYDVASRQFGKDAGGYGATVQGGYFLNGQALYELETGKGLLQLKPGLATPDTLYAIDGKSLTASVFPPEQVEERDRRGRRTTRYQLTSRWKADLTPAPEELFLMAGPHLYAGRKDGLVMAIDLANSGQPRISWQAQISGTPGNMIAADQRLFISTREGRLYCFGPKPVPPETFVFDPPQMPLDRDHWTDHALQLLQAAGTTEGYGLALGLGTGRLIDELLHRSKLHLIVVDPDPNKVQAFRVWMDRLGLYGRRVEAKVGNPFLLRLPPYLFNLVASEDLQAAGFQSHLAAPGGFFDVLRPYGGLAAFHAARPGSDQLLAWTRQSPPSGFQITQEADLIIIQRPGPLPGAGSWTHQGADPANSMVSQDTLVKAPLGLLWFGGPSNEQILPRHGHGPTPHVLGGRLFIEGPDVLRAVDVYSGRMLWQRDLPGIGKFYNNTDHQPGANEIGGNYVSTPDAVYVMQPQACLLLDPASGQTLNQFTLPAPDGRTRPKWGSIAAWQDLLIATASPIAVSTKSEGTNGHPKDSFHPALTDPHEWQYLAGSHPKESGSWTALDYDDSSWKNGSAGFGYGDDDDVTELADMRNGYTTLYLRQEFQVERVQAALADLQLAVRYDDAFIAYLNGQEVLRVGVGEGSGANASDIKAHEAEGFDYFDLTNVTQLLRPGRNILALEGHNDSRSSSDFSLDPWLGLPGSKNQTRLPAGGLAQLDNQAISGLDINADYAASSGTLVVMNRHTGEILWSRPATYSFRHNAIALGTNTVFCLDKLSDQKASHLRRRGLQIEADATLYALDARTGQVRWQSNRDVFGTWLAYSAEHDVLIEAGSAARDRADDEVQRGLAAYRGSTGQLLWRHDEKYEGPCLLHHDTIITQGHAYDLLTGQRRSRPDPLSGQPIPWTFTRNYGCNTAIGSEHLITFRSAAAGFYDLVNDAGTGNLGGFRSGCTSSLIAADGVLNSPDYTHTCICSYQNQTSLALIHMPEAELWTFNQLAAGGDRVRQLGINFGAPGDRRADNGVLWLEYPVVGGPSPKFTVSLEPTRPAAETGANAKPEFAGTTFRQHPALIESGPLPWVAASGLENVQRLQITLGPPNTPSQPYTVRLCFAEPSATQAAARTFHVSLQNQPVLENFNIAREAGGPRRSIIKEQRGLQVGATLEITLEPLPNAPPPILCGVEITAETP